MRIDQALEGARLKLRSRPGIPSPERELRLLLAAVLRRDELWVRAHPEIELDLEDLETFGAWVQRREAGEALEYITGCCSFFGRSFRVSPAVLIPRPESELIVEAVLGVPTPARILDVGTGSGCLAVSLKAERPAFDVVAVDLSRTALEVAASNAARHAADVAFLQGHLATALRGPFDVVVANLPYLPSSWLETLPVEVRKEPRMALDGGPDGLDFIRELLSDLPRILAPEGRVLLEIAEDQREGIETAAAAAGLEIRRAIRDIGGCERILVLAAGEAAGV